MVVLVLVYGSSKRKSFFIHDDDSFSYNLNFQIGYRHRKARAQNEKSRMPLLDSHAEQSRYDMWDTENTPARAAGNSTKPSQQDVRYLATANEEVDTRITGVRDLTAESAERSSWDTGVRDMAIAAAAKAVEAAPAMSAQELANASWALASMGLSDEGIILSRTCLQLFYNSADSVFLYAFTSSA
jgi:hypothetical protein